MENPPEKPKTLEMRVAELEDKMSKLHITEEEMKTYQKVATALGTKHCSASNGNAVHHLSLPASVCTTVPPAVLSTTVSLALQPTVGLPAVL
jgi:hypothetical protein